MDICIDGDRKANDNQEIVTFPLLCTKTCYYLVNKCRRDLSLHAFKKKDKVDEPCN